jgi:hypothetical protein
VPLAGMRSHEGLPKHVGFPTSDAPIQEAGTEAIQMLIEHRSLAELSRSYTIIAPKLHSGRGPGVVAFSEGTMPEEAFVA